MITIQSSVPEKFSSYQINARSIKITERLYQSLATTLEVADIETITKYDSPFEDIIASLVEVDRR
ncbi:hypothetical protein [Streptococcus hyointestinalis]|uniref:hypothetical protein n=1 Tax=Streptococcus hyointestinalis TaxID=1337 RepID=UPI0013DF48A0|nr:hypothetical protein [Streptococcus hyointestinalis]